MIQVIIISILVQIIKLHPTRVIKKELNWVSLRILIEFKAYKQNKSNKVVVLKGMKKI